MKNQIENLVASMNGKVIFLDEEAKIVLWQKGDDEFVVHNIYKNEDNYFLDNGNYAYDISQAMLSFLARKNVKLSIEVDLSEEDLSNLNDGESFNWTFEDEKSSIEIDVRLSNSYEE